ncbi:Leucine-rich repeat-containing protein 56 [Schistosoma haematobium]|uniref:Leucine-rich repeat-containing protein 56 n=2 Tax=Schistosoma haematobium TaxID=6185 RepID=A0A922LJ91_SCHHA|nr:Leucine-rich repeat-containing protein 56 [Schistosoma haematobium]KAH9587246.1 Leucine-rich repeat-containing protein 56 [Schistosoma haematobium]
MAMTELQPSSDIRPKSALVQIIEIQEKTVNPTPALRRLSETLTDEFLSEQKLRELTGFEDLSMVSTLDLEVDTDRMSVANFGTYLPNLRHLRLSNSNIPSVRDLGTFFNNVEVIWMPRCCLVSLDGLSSFTKLVELYIAFNGVSDLSPCAMLDNIEVIDLEGNLIERRSSLSYLRLCHNLTSLTLEGNPFVTKHGGKVRYRKVVREELPQITVLDDIPIQKNPVSHSGEYDITKFDSEWEYINILLKEIGLLSGKAKNIVDGEKSGYLLATGEAIEAGRSTLGLRPTSALKKYQKNTIQFTEPKDGHNTLKLSRSSSVMMEKEVNSDDEELVSELTTGKVICGGISTALRRRRFSLQTGKVEKIQSACLRLESESVTSSALEQSYICSLKEGNPTQNEPSGQQTNNIKTVLDHETITNEEFYLRRECDIVLKELAEWRKLHSESKVLDSCKSTKRRKNKITKADLEFHTVILSPNNDENTPDNHIDLQEECTEDVITSNKPLKNCNEKPYTTHKKKLANSNQNQNNKNTAPFKMSNEIDESQIKTKQVNVGTSSINNRSVNNNRTLSEFCSSSYSLQSTNSDLINTNSSSIFPITSNCSSNRQKLNDSPSHVECFFDEQLIVENGESSTQDIHSQKLSLKNNHHHQVQHQPQISKVSNFKSSHTSSTNRINRNESGNKLALKFTKSSNSTIQPLPSKPLVKHTN